MTDSGRIVESEADLKTIVRTVQTVAVVGMKDESQEDTAAFQIPKMLVKHGLTVFPVNPKIRRSLGLNAHPSLAALGHPVDLVNVFRRPEAVGPLADEILALPADRRPKIVWMQSGIRNDEAAARLTAVGIQVVMDACLGVYVSRYR